MDNTQLDQRYRVILLVWAALAMGVALFAGAVWALTSGVLGEPSAAMDAGVLRPALAVSVLLLLAGVMMRRGGWGGGSQGDSLERYQTSVIVAWAVQEGGGLFALALAFIAGEPRWALAMGGLTVFALLLTRPTRAEVEQAARR